MSDSNSKSKPPRFARGFFVSPETGSPRRSAVFVGCLLVALLLTLLSRNTTDIQPAARRALFILLLSVFLWVTEAIPAFSVGILVIGLQILLLGNPNAGVFAHSDRDWGAVCWSAWASVALVVLWRFCSRGRGWPAALSINGSRRDCWRGLAIGLPTFCWE